MVPRRPTSQSFGLCLKQRGSLNGNWKTALLNFDASSSCGRIFTNTCSERRLTKARRRLFVLIGRTLTFGEQTLTPSLSPWARETGSPHPSLLPEGRGGERDHGAPISNIEVGAGDGEAFTGELDCRAWLPAAGGHSRKVCVCNLTSSVCDLAGSVCKLPAPDCKQKCSVCKLHRGDCDRGASVCNLLAPDCNLKRSVCNLARCPSCQAAGPGARIAFLGWKRGWPQMHTDGHRWTCSVETLGCHGQTPVCPWLGARRKSDTGKRSACPWHPHLDGFTRARWTQMG